MELSFEIKCFEKKVKIWLVVYVCTQNELKYFISLYI